VTSVFCFKSVTGEGKVGMNEANNTFITCNVCMLVMKLLHHQQYNRCQKVQVELCNITSYIHNLQLLSSVSISDSEAVLQDSNTSCVAFIHLPSIV
jgi:hypothetical protein